ncbi:hypothetical protein QC762_503380 [Podospora pseudocomata]|uniref:Heterokaryon incompatibility domain-containing protein n=1 Tax=Podospora pseudocomata TaxID=2093779 RepID=A0ABR0GB85_9PEZI|nr:hypothetical protein QC762_503380 [Podospora pseudocomata]
MAQTRGVECYKIGPGFVSRCFPRGFEHDTWSRLDFDSTQWASRAWTFQEATLSTLMILFAQSGRYFSCGAGLVWEYGGVLEEPLNSSVHGIVQDTSAADMYRNWNLKIATQFLGRQATYLADSLLALSGTAQIFATALDDEYVAGLWKGDLLAGLFWKMKDSLRSYFAELLQSLDDPWIRPSWSWVGRPAGRSAVGKVRGFGPGRCNLYPARSSAVLRMQYDTLKAQTVPSGMTSMIRVYPLALGWYHLPDDDDDCDGKRLSDTGNSYLEQPGDNKVAFSYHLDFFPNPDVNDPHQSWKQDLTLVLLGSINYESSESEDDLGETPCGLIIHQAKRNSCEYCRVGTFGPSTSEASSGTVFDLDMDFCYNWESRSPKVI